MQRSRTQKDVDRAVFTHILRVGLLLVMVSQTTRVWAQEPDDASLRFDAPASCPGMATFEAHVRHFLDRPAGELFGDVRVALTVTTPGTAGPYTLVLVLTDANDVVMERTVSHRARCALLIETAAFMTAMAIDPEAVSRNASLGDSRADAAEADARPEPTTSGVEQIVATPANVFETVAEPRADVPVAAPLRDAVRYGAGLDLGVGAGLLPKASLDAVLRGFLERRALRLELGVHAQGPRTRTIEPISDATSQFWAMRATLAGCYVLGRGKLTAPLCAALDAGAVMGRARGDQITAATRAHRLSISSSLRPSLRIELSRRLALLARADLGVALVRPVFGVHGLAAPVHEGSRFVAGTTLGVEATWH